MSVSAGRRSSTPYSDPRDGEIGTVYQACNWIYLGEGVGRCKGRAGCGSSIGAKADGAQSAFCASEGSRPPSCGRIPTGFPTLRPTRDATCGSQGRGARSAIFSRR